MKAFVVAAEERPGDCIGRSWPDTRLGSGSRTGSPAETPASRSIEHWRGVTLRMGLLYERAAVEFWAGVASQVGIADAATARARTEDDGARIAMNEAWRDVRGQAQTNTMK